MANYNEGITSAQVLNALSRVKDPKTQQDIVSLGWVGEILIRFGKISFPVHIDPNSKVPEEEIRSACIGAVKSAIPDVLAVLPNITRKPRAQTPTIAANTSNIENIIVVGSGKGGVGKSTTTVNLALALVKNGYRVGLLDADIYGPSIPTMLGKGLEEIIGRPDQVTMHNNQMVPFSMHGVKVMSVAMLIEKNQPTVWRAPIATKMIQQFLTGVNWGDLDFLLIDLPPGTGDIQLTLSQQANIDGAIIVTTPQKVALQIAEKGLLMFQHVGVPILGIIETMHGDVFGKNGALELAEKARIPLLGQIPMDAELVKASDEGEPIVVRNRKATSAVAYEKAGIAVVESMKKIKSSFSSQEVVPIAVEGIPNDPENAGKHSVAIFWSDGWKYTYDCRELRALCPCAACVDEFSGERKIKIEDISEDVYIEKALPVGRYGINLVWTDKHSTGIYTYAYLREQKCIKVKESPNTSSAPEAHGGV